MTMEGIQQQPQPEEMAKLERIQAKVKEIESKLATRLPRHEQQLTALICAWKWWVHVQPTRYELAVKKLRMELSSFEYQVKETAELLTRHLCELDNILSFGNMDVKEARKALVVYIQQLLERADALRRKSMQLTAFGDAMMARMKQSAAARAVKTALTSAQEQPQEQEQDVDMAAEETTSDAEEEEAEAEEYAMDGEQEVENEDSDNDQDMAADAQEESENQTASQTAAGDDDAAAEDQPNEESMDFDVQSLPVWWPYYHIQKRPDGLRLMVKLHGIDRRHVDVEYVAHTGALRISGFKQPTRKDLILSRFSGAPTFGRFEIIQRFPVNMVNLEAATRALDADGTLQVHVPYYMIQHPRFLRRPAAAHFAPRCAVW